MSSTDSERNGMASGERAYIGSFTSSGGHGITVAAVHADTGALTVRHTTSEVPDPSYLTLAPGGDVLYAVSETESGAAAALRLTDPDRPRVVDAPVSVHGSAPTHVALVTGYLLTANYGSHAVSVLPTGPDGCLTEPVRVLEHHGHGPHPDRQREPHPHAVHPDPSGRWVLAVDLGTDSVWRYGLDAAGGRPQLRGEARMRAGTGPRHLGFHPLGHRAYLVNELSSTLTQCRWDAATGDLEAEAECSTLPDGVTTRNYPSEVVIAPDGRFAWVANRGHDSIAVIGLDRSGTGMELLGTVECGGRWPRDLAIDPTGRRLYAANEHSGDVSWFDIDQTSGRPLLAGALATPAPSCVIFR